MGIEKGNLSWRKNKNLVILDFVDNIVQKFEPSKSNFPFPFLSLFLDISQFTSHLYTYIYKCQNSGNKSKMESFYCVSATL